MPSAFQTQALSTAPLSRLGILTLRQRCHLVHLMSLAVLVREQTQDRLWTATEGVAGVPDKALSGGAASEVVGDDSMVVGKGIMIKGDVEDCAVSP